MTCKLEVEMDVAFWASPGWRIICIGDQHGEINLMRQLLELATGLKTTAPQTKIVYLGDLIDRGPDSLACLDLAISSQMFDGIDAVGNVCGNHEEMLYSAMFGKTAEIRMVAHRCWEMNGGSSVIKQLGKPKTTKDLRDALGDQRLAWLRNMTTWDRCGQFLFVHAGLNPALGESQIHQKVGIDLTNTFDESSSTRWIRKPFHPSASARPSRLVRILRHARTRSKRRAIALCPDDQSLSPEPRRWLLSHQTEPHGHDRGKPHPGLRSVSVT